MSWTLIEHQQLSSSAASVTLGSGGTIPQTYKTLKLVCSIRTTAAANNDDLGIRYNGSSTSYANRYVYGTGSTANSGSAYTDRNYIGSQNAANSTANTFSNVEITIPNYAGATNKPMSVDSVMENNGTESFSTLQAGIWSNTSAITSILVGLGSGSFVSGSTFTLYGLK